MNVYLWNNRVITEKEVDRYLNRIVHEKRNRIIKYVLIGTVSAGMLFALVMLCANKQKENVVKSEIKSQPVNSATTVAYIINQNTK